MDALDKLVEAIEAGSYDAGEKRHKRFNAFCDDWEALSGIHEHPSYTAAWNAYNGSLDAALALHEALLPGWPVRVMDHSQEYLGGHGGHACVNWPHMDAPKGKASYPADSYSYTAWSATPARAWLLAILRAHRAASTPSDGGPIGETDI